MKYVLLVVVVLAVLWLLKPRVGLRARQPARPAEPATSATEPMVSCAHCGVHLPRSDALPGRGGVFCGEAHRAAHERAGER